MPSKLEDELAERMLAAFHEAKRLKYNAVRFFQMLNDRGALATAKSLLAGDVNKVSDGFTAMWNLKRLDLTVEAICLDFRFKSLFTEQELATAYKRLENAGYSPSIGLGDTLWRLGNTIRETMIGPETQHLLRVFLCHSSGDKPKVRNLYERLKQDGFAPWLDEKDLLPGQDWRHEISAAVRACSVVVVCLSRGSITKEGYVQREIKTALDVAEEKPQGTIFIIPARLEEVEVPERLSQWQWVNLFQAEGYERLILALGTRAKTLGINMSYSAPVIKQKPDISTKGTSKKCRPISVSLEVNPSYVRKIVFGLEKICNNDATVEWKLHFDLQVRSYHNGSFRSLVKLDVDIHAENYALAEATAINGMDEEQRARAAVAGATAEEFDNGTATIEDAKHEAEEVIAARNPNSPGARV